MWSSFSENIMSYKLAEQSEQNQLQPMPLLVAHLLLKSCQRKKFVALQFSPKNDVPLKEDQASGSTHIQQRNHTQQQCKNLLLTNPLLTKFAGPDFVVCKISTRNSGNSPSAQTASRANHQKNNCCSLKFGTGAPSELVALETSEPRTRCLQNKCIRQYLSIKFKRATTTFPVVHSWNCPHAERFSAASHTHFASNKLETQTFREQQTQTTRQHQIQASNNHPSGSLLPKPPARWESSRCLLHLPCKQRNQDQQILWATNLSATNSHTTAMCNLAAIYTLSRQLNPPLAEHHL